MKLTELGLSDVIGDVRAAQLKQGAGRLMGTPGSEMSTKDRMVKDNFIKNFVGRAVHDIDSMIKSGAVYPEVTPEVPAATQQNTGPETPEQKRIRLQKAAQQQADLQGVPVNKPAAPPTPAQVRQQKQAQAAQAAQQGMSPVSKLPANQFAKTAATVRQQQQAPVAQAAQKNMAPVSSLPANQYAKSAENVRKQKQAAAAAALKESMISEAPAMSIADYLMDMVDQYTGVDLTKYQPHIKALAKEVENTYSKNKAKDALYKLGNLLYGISYAANPVRTGANTLAKAGQAQTQQDASPAGKLFGIDTGASSAEQPTQQSSVAKQALANVGKMTTQKSSDELVQIIQSSLRNLKKVDRPKYQKLLKQYASGKVSAAPQAPSQPGAEFKEPITIGGEKIKPNDPAYSKIMKNAPVTESKAYKKWGEK